MRMELIAVVVVVPSRLMHRHLEVRDITVGEQPGEAGLRFLSGRACATAGWGIKSPSERQRDPIVNFNQPRAAGTRGNDWAVIVYCRRLNKRAMARFSSTARSGSSAGLYRLSPVERGTAGTGGQLAIARALSDLARHLARSPVRQ